MAGNQQHPYHLVDPSPWPIVGALAAFASTYRNYGVASTTEVNGRVLSVGAFGMVFVMQGERSER